MERMLRKKKDNSGYEIDRELTGKFAIEKNAEYQEKIEQLEEENKKLKEFKTKREESMFYFKALAERAEPINSKEAEELQKYKKLFEKLYREELYYLEEENKNLKEEVRFLEECLDRKEKVNKSLREELSAYDREYFDEDKKAKNIFMEEDTLQELRDLGKI